MPRSGDSDQSRMARDVHRSHVDDMRLFATLAWIALAGCQNAAAVPSDDRAVDKIDPPLLAQLDSAESVPVAILLRTQLLIGPEGLSGFIAENGHRPRGELRSEIVQTLEETAEREQTALRERLDLPPDARGLWIANAIFGALTPEQIRAAALDEGVRYIYLMPRPPADYDQPGEVSTVLAPGARSPFDLGDRRIPWNVERIGAAEVWRDLGITGEGVVVALFDNGTNYAHPDLSSNVWTNPGEVANNGLDDDGNGLVDDYYGFDFRRGLAEVQMRPALGQSAGHGTFTSGIVLGDGTGGIATGVAPRARLMISLVGGDAYAMGRGLQYALEEGADVGTMSFSLADLGNVRGLWRLMSDHAVAGGLVLVSGAGNFQQSAPPGLQQRIPEGIPSVISVGGVDPELQLAPFSSLGPVSWSSVVFYEDHAALTKPDVVAFPGPEYPILRAEESGYLDPNTRRGNSFSGPHAAGVAALMLSANPDLPAWEVKAIMEATARDLPPAGLDHRTGAGLIDAAAAVRAALARR